MESLKVTQDLFTITSVCIWTIFIALPLCITTRDFKSNNQDVTEAQTSAFLSAAFITVFFITVRITDIFIQSPFSEVQNHLDN